MHLHRTQIYLGGRRQLAEQFQAEQFRAGSKQQSGEKEKLENNAVDECRRVLTKGELSLRSRNEWVVKFRLRHLLER